MESVEAEIINTFRYMKFVVLTHKFAVLDLIKSKYSEMKFETSQFSGNYLIRFTDCFCQK
jgi:hypothetical protein